MPNRLAIRVAIVLALAAGGSAAEDRFAEGREAYQGACAKCHDSGILGAPVVGNPEDWADRSPLWEAVLFEHAEKGFLKMPAKGGDKTASGYSVEAAAEYMLSVTNPDLPRD